MSRLFILSMGLPMAMMIASPSFAQTVDDLIAQNQKLMTQNSQFSSDLQVAKKEISTAQSSVDVAQKAYDQAESDYNSAETAWHNNVGKYVPTFMAGDGDPALKKAMDDAKSKMTNAHTNLAVAQQTLDKDQKKADDLQDQQGKVLKDIQAVNGNYDEKSKAIANVIQSTSLVSKFTQLQQKVGSAQTTLNRLSAVYDQSVLGAYMKDKMANLLNSNALCEAQKSCQAGKTPSVSASEIQKAFIGSHHTSTGSTPASGKSSSGTH